ncbi:cob(I)yrinic acid a,c-diamide adenosyltransferase [Spongiibacter sp.]|uniref:cob(I)yrinic acid a,c-diamide adenosyltransferase n=1 Tax=Spongiibacter sp. TaxID=2024860 RepID=UPI00356A9A4E
MGHRLSKIYTRTGDDGSTGLGDGSRINKDHVRMESIGNVDELNSQIGLLIAELPAEDDFAALLSRIQHDLFDLGGELAVPGYTLVNAERIGELEQSLDALNEDLPPLKNFILPGGSKPAALCHLARAICRRAERSLVALSREDQVNDTSRQYLNRLSDFLFVMARLLARRNGGDEVLWQPADKR